MNSISIKSLRALEEKDERLFTKGLYVIYMFVNLVNVQVHIKYIYLKWNYKLADVLLLKAYPFMVLHV